MKLKLHNKIKFQSLLNYVATPHYDCAGCDGATYSSFVFAREAIPLTGFRGKIAAVNGMDSMSGMLALKLVFDRFPGIAALSVWSV